jgi:hypothetical protein
METLWDWSPLNDCFANTTIRVSDLDGIVERNGHFLVLDGKRPDLNGRRDIQNGQRLLYKRLAETGFSVIVFHGYPPHEVQFVRQWTPGGGFIPERPCTLPELHQLVVQWFEIANEGV